jgi:hypothetical protein
LATGGFGFSAAGSIGDALGTAWAAGTFARGAMPFANSAKARFVVGEHDDTRNAGHYRIAITCGLAYKASPGRIWPDLQPWRPSTQGTIDRLKRWLDTRAEDRLRLSMSKASSVASELMKLPRPTVKKETWSDSTEAFVIRSPSRSNA